MYSGKMTSATRNSTAAFNDQFGAISFENGSSQGDGYIYGDFYFQNNIILGNNPPQEIVNLRGVKTKLGKFRIKPANFWRTEC